MNLDPLTELLMRMAAVVRRIAPTPYAYLNALRVAWGPSGYFRAVGLLRSYAEGRPCRADGRPLPLLAYDIIALLDDRLRSDHSVFEYGSGHSTRYLAERVARVVSVEHDRDWAEQLSRALPPNATILHVPLVPQGRYCEAILDRDERFDVVLVDGRDRVNCLIHATERVSASGVVLLDDSEREHYRAGLDAMAERGFRRLDFEGMKPYGVAYSRTTLFYRPGNCLGV